MGLPFTLTLTDVWANDWPLNQRGCPVRIKAIRLGSAGYSFDEVQGATQQGTTVLRRNDDPNVIPIEGYVDGPKGAAGVARLSEWRRANGRGMVDGYGSQLMRLTVEETQRWANIRLMQWRNEPQWQQIHACGRAYFEADWRSDEAYWSADDITLPPVTITSGTTTIVAPNMGDLAVWPTIRLYGPITTPKIAFGTEEAVQVASAIPIGGYYDIVTDPDYWAITDSSNPPVDHSWIGRRWQQKIEPGGTTVTITGSNYNSNTRAVITVPQRFWEPL